MLDHMLFNLQKWFAIDDNTDSVIINNNQYYKVPKRVKTPPPETMRDLCVNGDPYTEHIYDCVGVSSMYYVLKGTVRQAGSGTMVTTFLVEKTGCTPIWGGKTSPIRLAIKALRHFTRRVAVAC